MAKVLLIEDDLAIARLLRDNLLYETFEVETDTTGIDAAGVMKRFKPDILLLDLMLPNGHGFDICRIASGLRDRPGIIILSSRVGKEDKVRGLDLGADDYVTKPFAFEELLARIKAVLRRRSSTSGVLRLGEVVVNFQTRDATLRGRDLGLSYREFAVLQYLADRPGKVVTRDELLQEVWGYHYLPLTRSVDIAIARLRGKIEPDPHRPRFIRTLHGEGYSFTPPA